MTDFFETTIKNYSGKSSETKPTIAVGNNVPNGSRWREVDTGKTFHFDKRTDAWYETGRQDKAISGASPMVDIRALSLFEQILTVIKKIEYHCSIASDTNLNDQDIGS